MQKWLEIAHRRWTNCPIQNAGDCSGRYAVAVIGENSGRTIRVILCETPEQQKVVALGYDRCNKVDLGINGAELLARIPDRHYERERRG